MANTIWRSN